MKDARPVVTLIGALTAEDPGDAESAPPEPPLGVLSLAAALKAHRVATEIIDLNLIWARSGRSSRRLFRNTTAAVLRSPPRILGLSSICSTYPLTLRLARTLKRKFPRTPVVIGGPQASAVDVATLTAFPFIDFVLRGEAEETFPQLVECLLSGDSPCGQPGLTFRDGPGVRRNPDAATIPNLDVLPLPALERYGDVPRRRSLPLEIGRGCPFSCRFCSTSGFFSRHYRLKSTDLVIRQMNVLSRRYGIREFELVHDMFTVDKRRVAEFCRGLHSHRARYRWSCSARTDCVDDELLRMMRDAGCEGIFFGIETGSQRIQRVIGKGLDLDRARAVLRESDRLGINTTPSLIIGYPDETTDDLRATLSFFRDAVQLDRADPQIHVLSPLATTSLESEYRPRLVFDARSKDIPEFGPGQGAGEKRLISFHPEVFPNFYAFPTERPQSSLLEISEFFVSLSLRCRGLLLALTERPCSPLELFEAWDRGGDHGRRSARYYRGLRFVEEFLAFVSAVYVGRGHAAVDVMWRFYSALMSAESRSRSRAVPAGPNSGKAAVGIVRLSPGVCVVSVDGDVVRVLECLKKGMKVGPDCLDRATSVAVQRRGGGRSVIAEVPPLASAILGCLDGSVDEVEEQLTSKGVCWQGLPPALFLRDALRILARDGLVTTTKPGGPPFSGAAHSVGRRGAWQ
jgi:tRNA A37 methylthiotransferase MiaB